MQFTTESTGIKLTEETKAVLKAITEAKGRYLDSHNSGTEYRDCSAVIVYVNSREKQYVVPLYSGHFCINPLELHEESKTGVMLSACSVGGVVKPAPVSLLQRLEDHNQAIVDYRAKMNFKSSCEVLLLDTLVTFN